MMIDTIKTVNQAIERASVNDGIDLINKVDSFYNSAWDKLIIVGSVAFGVIGILVPFVIQWYQKKNLKINEELLKKYLEGQILILKSEVLSEVSKAIDNKIESFDKKIVKMNASINAKAFHLQARSLFNSKLYPKALADFIVSAEEFLICEDFKNLQSVLQVIQDSCLPKLSMEEINDLSISDNIDINNFLNDLETKDDKGIFTKIIRDIRLKLSKLPKTTKDKIVDNLM
ncbi:MAG: hypothetical protein J0L67_18880 [Cytophagales bacterium]|nr:hypothetical protein [Cytophagales bacterium]